MSPPELRKTHVRPVSEWEGGVELPQGTDTPGVTEFPQEDKNHGVTTTGKGSPVEGGRIRGWDETPPTTGATGAQGAGANADKWMGEPRTALPPRPKRVTAVDNSSTGTPTRHTAGTDGTRPEHGALA